MFEESQYKLKCCYLGAALVMRQAKNKDLDLENIDDDVLEDLSITFGNLYVKVGPRSLIYYVLYTRINEYLAGR